MSGSVRMGATVSDGFPPCVPDFIAGADDYEALLRRHQDLEAEHQRSQDTIADLRGRIESLTGPQGPQSKLRHMQHQTTQVSQA